MFRSLRARPGQCVLAALSLCCSGCAATGETDAVGPASRTVDGSASDATAPDAGTGLSDAAPSGDVAPSTSEPRCGALHVRVRDFKREHPDFEDIVNGRVVTGIVSSTLGSDRKPVLDPLVAQANGVTRFEDWYVDRAGVSLPFDHDIQLSATGNGRFVFDSDAFFPIDDKGFGKEYLDHNFHFTTEIHTRFVYRAGDVFTFSGDDDLWLFINGHLAIDLGGVHAREQKTVDLDQRKAELGIEPGATYAMDIFHAERHTGSSNFRIETTIQCIESVVLL